MHHHGEGIFFPPLHWLAVHLGIANENSPYYAWWSGSGSDVWGYTVAATVLVATYHMVRKHNCREHRCWRIGIHTWTDVDGQVHPACRVHHPTMKVGHRIHFADMHRHKQRIESEKGL